MNKLPPPLWGRIEVGGHPHPHLPPSRGKEFVILILSLLFNSQISNAAPLTWEEVVRETSQKNPDLAAERASVRIAEANYKASLAPFLPTLNGHLNVSRTDSEFSIPSNEFGASLSAGLNVFNGFGDVGRRAQNRANLDAARARYNSVSAQLSQLLKNAFTRLVFAQEQLALTTAIADRRRENLRLVQLRYEGGRENKGSYLRTKADYNASLFDVNQASRTLHVAQREMGRAIGRGGYETLIATGTIPVGAIPVALPNFEALAKQTPDYVQSDAERRRTESGVIVARSGFSPTLGANASAGRTSGTWFPDDNDRWTIGAALSIPIFSGGSTYQDVQRAKAERDRATFDQVSVDQQLALNLEDAFTGYVNATENINVQNEYAEAARVRAEIARGQYANGLISFFDWDGIENELITRQKSKLAAWRDAVIAEAAWENTQGTGAIR